jgi:formiminoglutamase
MGAAEGPKFLRMALANMAWHSGSKGLYDAGDVVCADGNLEASQARLAEAVAQLRGQGHFTVVLGGGHETALGHFTGLQRHAGRKPVGIINLDAHFDLRRYESEGTSGTPFLQAARQQEAQGLPFHYLALGIYEGANTEALFATARELGVQWATNRQLAYGCPPEVKRQIEDFCRPLEAVYLSIDLDVFQVAHAPGVSAPATFGISPAVGRELLGLIMGTGKVAGMDVVELNPAFDVDYRTAKLGAHLIYEAVTGSVKQ